MKILNIRIIIGCFIVLLATSPFILFAGGNESANGGLFLPRNKAGKLIQVSFGVKHPQHEKLLNLIKRAELPKNLREEMIQDLISTSIIYSNELVLYEDFMRHVNAAPVNLILDDLGKTFVTAYTVRNPKVVIYFSPMLEQLSDNELLKLVLHEQAHRLQVLHQFNHDERAVEAYSAALTAYLSGKMPQEKFYQILQTNGVSIISDFEFRNEKRWGDVITATIHVLLSKDELDALLNFSLGRLALSFFHNRGRRAVSLYFLQVKTSIFKDYPILTQEPYEKISLAFTLDGAYSDPDYKLMKKFYSKIKESDTPTPLELVVHYTRQISTRDSNGRYQESYQIINIEYNPVDRTKQILDRLNTITRNHPFVNFGVFAEAEYLDWSAHNAILAQAHLIEEAYAHTRNTHFFAMDEHLQNKVYKISQMMNSYLDKFKIKNPYLYNYFLKHRPYQFHFMLSETEGLFRRYDSSPGVRNILIDNENLENESPFKVESLAQVYSLHGNAETLYHTDDKNVQRKFSEWANKEEENFNTFLRHEIIPDIRDTFGYDLNEGSIRSFNGNLSYVTQFIIHPLQDFLNKKLGCLSKEIEKKTGKALSVSISPSANAFLYKDKNLVRWRISPSNSLTLLVPPIVLFDQSLWKSFSKKFAQKVLTEDILVRQDPKHSFMRKFSFWSKPKPYYFYYSSASWEKSNEIQIKKEDLGDSVLDRQVYEIYRGIFNACSQSASH